MSAKLSKKKEKSSSTDAASDGIIVSNRHLIAEEQPSPIPPRHYHASCTNEDGTKLYISFGQQDGDVKSGKNSKQKTDIWCFDITRNNWKKIFFGGKDYQKEYRHQMICRKDKLYLFGRNTSELLTVTLDESKFVDSNTGDEELNHKLMSQLVTKGDSPPSLEGHLMLYDSREDCILISGGKDKLQNCLYKLDCKTNVWEEIVPEFDTLPPLMKTTLGGLLNGNLYIFDGALNDERIVWQFNFGKMKWSELKTKGEGPSKASIGLAGCQHGQSLIIAGGMEKNTYKLDLDTATWERIKPSFINQPQCFGSLDILTFEDRNYYCFFGGAKKATGTVKSTATFMIGEEMFITRNEEKQIVLYQDFFETYNREYPDVTLHHVQTGNKYKVHRHVLAGVSQYFQLLFLAYDENAKNTEVRFSIDDPYNFLSPIIDYIYTGKIQLYQEHIVQLRGMAKKLHLNCLGTKVLDYLNNYLTRNNAFGVLKSAIKANDPEFIDKSLEFICEEIVPLKDDFEDVYRKLTPKRFFYMIRHAKTLTTSLAQRNTLASFSRKYINHFKIEESKEHFDYCIFSMVHAGILSPDLAAKYMSTCLKMDLKERAEDCFGVLVKKFADIQDVSGLYTLNFATFYRLMDAEELMASNENSVFKSCSAFIDHHPELSDDQKKKLMMCVRLPHLSFDFAQQVRDNPYISKKRIIEALMHRIRLIEDPKYNGSGLKRLQSRKNTNFAYQSDWDTNGILYFLGCSLGQSPWKNPMDLGLVNVTAPTTFESGSAKNIVGRASTSTNLRAKVQNYIQIHFKKCQIQPTHYTLRHTQARASEFLRQWKLEGSNNSVNWTNLDTRSDSSLNSIGATHTYTCNSKGTFYKYIRLTQTAKNSSNSEYLSIQGIEFYGKIG